MKCSLFRDNNTVHVVSVQYYTFPVLTYSCYGFSSSSTSEMFTKLPVNYKLYLKVQMTTKHSHFKKKVKAWSSLESWYQSRVCFDVAVAVCE